MLNLVDFLNCTASSEKIEAHFAGHCEDTFELREHKFERPEHEYSVISIFSMYDRDLKDSYLEVTLNYLGEDENYAKSN